MKFQVTDKIKIPQKLKEVQVEKYILVLAYEYPNWIVLDEKEYNAFRYLKEHSIRESMLMLQQNEKYDEEIILSTVENILQKIVEVDFFEEIEILKEEPMENIKKSIHINLTSDCNLRCRHCFLSAGYIEKQIVDIDRIKAFITEFTDKFGETEIVLSGGEPLIYSGLYDLVSFCKELKHKTVLFTNGLLINPNNIHFLAEHIDEIQISMEGISLEKFELIRGNGTYTRLLESLKLIKDKNIALTLAITVLSETIDDVYENLAGFIESYDYQNLNIRLNDEIEKKGNAVNLSDENFNTTNKTKVNEIMQQLVNGGHTYRSSKERNIQFTNCGIGTCIVVNYDGLIYPCLEYDIEFATINDNMIDIVQKFNKLNDTTGLANMKKCENCDLKYVCNGGCRIKNKLENNSFIIPICDEIYKQKKYSSLVSDYLRGVK